MASSPSTIPTSATPHDRTGCPVVNDPTGLLEGMDDLDEEDRRRLDEVLSASEDDLKAGRVRPAEDVLADLRRPPLTPKLW